MRSVESSGRIEITLRLNANQVVPLLLLRKPSSKYSLCAPSDTSDTLSDTFRNGLQIIQKSLTRVAKKKFSAGAGGATGEEMEKYTRGVMENIKTTTDA